jgi:hypothetical protein
MIFGAASLEKNNQSSAESASQISPGRKPRE